MTTNTKFLLATSYVCYFFTGSLFTTLGVFIPPIAVHFNLDASAVGYLFTLLNAGLFITIASAGYLLKKFKIARLLNFSVYLVVGSAIFLALFHHFIIYAAILFIFGFCAGIFMATGSYLISAAIKNTTHRASKLIFADFFFSLAGIVLPALFGKLLAAHVVWYLFYLIMALPSLLIWYWTSKIDFTDVTPSSAHVTAQLHLKERWSLTIYLVALSCTLFILTELMTTTWVVKYLQNLMHYPLATASSALSIYWLAKAVGLFINQYTVRGLGIMRYIVSSVIIGMVAISSFAVADHTYILFSMIALFGFVNSGIYAGLIGYGSGLIRTPSATLIAFLITSGTTGTLFSSGLSATLVKYSGIDNIMKWCALSYAACLVIVMIAFVSNRFLNKTQPV